jgi:hypothetical protein
MVASGSTLARRTAIASMRRERSWEATSSLPSTIPRLIISPHLYLCETSSVIELPRKQLPVGPELPARFRPAARLPFRTGRHIASALSFNTEISKFKIAPILNILLRWIFNSGDSRNQRWATLPAKIVKAVIHVGRTARHCRSRTDTARIDRSVNDSRQTNGCPKQTLFQQSGMSRRSRFRSRFVNSAG